MTPDPNREEELYCPFATAIFLCTNSANGRDHLPPVLAHRFSGLQDLPFVLLPSYIASSCIFLILLFLNCYPLSELCSNMTWSFQWLIFSKLIKAALKTSITFVHQEIISYNKEIETATTTLP